MFKPWSLRLLQVHLPYHKHRSIEYVPIPHRVIILQRLISTSIAFTSCTRWQTRVSEREFAIDSPFAPFVIPDCCNILSALKSTIFIVHGSNATTKSSSVSNMNVTFLQDSRVWYVAVLDYENSAVPPPE